jgi:hypothetical protein
MRASAFTTCDAPHDLEELPNTWLLLTVPGAARPSRQQSHRALGWRDLRLKRNGKTSRCATVLRL